MSTVGRPEGRIEWWCSFYEQHAELRDWYLPNDVVMERVVGACEKKVRETPVLHVGCGTSEISLLLHEHGFRNVVNMDCSPAAIEAMKRPDMTFEVGDVSAMGYADGRFGLVLDKGTLDCVALSKDGADAMLSEIRRVLINPGGQFLCFSLVPPERRLDLFHRIWPKEQVVCEVLDHTPLENPNEKEVYLYICRR